MLLLAVIVIGAPALALYVAPLLPILTALVTKATAPSWVKAGVLVFLSAVSALVAPVIQNGGSITLDEHFAATFVITYVVAIATYYGLSKPVGVAGENGLVARKIPGGIG